MKVKSTFESSRDRKHEAKKTSQFTEFVCPYKTFKQLTLLFCFVLLRITVVFYTFLVGKQIDQHSCC